MSLGLHLAELAAWSGARLVGADVVIDAVSTDTRTLARGSLFAAIAGEHHDGHDFAESARKAGAAALLVARELPVALPQLVVDDTQRALGDIARGWRLRCRARVAGITGSNGKTTVKTMLGAILARHGRSHVNPGNLNNEIGLPLALLAMPADTEFAAFEMGAGKPGDIAWLAGIARPDVALVNNVAPAHLARLGSLQGVAETKGAIYRALPPEGVAVINADDAFAGYFTRLAAPRRTLRFGLQQPADVTASFVAERLGSGEFRLLFRDGHADVHLALPGRHNVMNSLAAASLAIALGVPPSTIAEGLREAPAVAGRQARRRLASGAVLIDDSYNANPGSFAAAIASLAAEPGERVLVMGDMAELGPEAARLHAAVGAQARQHGIERLLAVGALSVAAVREFGRGGEHYPEQAALVQALAPTLGPGVAVLVKGSRSSAMERVVAALDDGPADDAGGAHAA